jgi:hypothetical protein
MLVAIIGNLNDDHDTGTHNHRDIANFLRLHFERDTDYDSTGNDNELILHCYLWRRLFLRASTQQHLRIW